MVATRVTPKASFAMRGQRQKGFARLFLKGELDMSTVPLFESNLQGVEREGDALILDLAGLTFTDSSGIHAFSRAAARADENGWQLEIVNSRTAVERVFGLTGTRDLLESTPGSGPSESSADGCSPISLLTGSRRP